MVAKGKKDDRPAPATPAAGKAAAARPGARAPARAPATRADPAPARATMAGRGEAGKATTTTTPAKKPHKG